MKVGTTTTAATTQGFIAARDGVFRGADDSAAPLIAWCPTRWRCRTRARRLAAHDGLGHIGLEKLPGIGSGWRLVDIDVGNDRGADEQRRLIGVVIDEIDPDRQPLDHLDEIARGVLGRQQCQGRSGPLGKAGDPALEDVLAAVHVDVQIDRLPDAQVAQLRFLEVGVNPDFVERANRHQVLADLNKIARIDVAPRDDAVDLRDDVGVTQIQFGLREIALWRLRVSPRPA